MEPLRLQKFLAAAGICSRRKAEQFISDGKIKVNGKVVTALGTKIDPNSDQVTAFDKPVTAAEKKVYYLLNKPKGYVTTLSDPQGRAVVTDLLKNVRERVFPVGRLDYDTEGALLLTNDGDLAQKTLHPRFETYKTYQAILQGTPSQLKLRNLEAGVMVDGKKTAPAKSQLISKGAHSCKVKVTIHEGRKHQVKKMFAAIGHPVLHLKRLSYGKLGLGDLQIGCYRALTTAEIELIFSKKS